MEPNSNHRIFVYGTLRSGSENKFFDLLKKNSRRIGIGKLKARLYDLGEYPGAKPAKNEREITVGEVYEIMDNKWSETIKKLDKYEGYDAKNINDSEYVRSQAKVKIGAKNVDVWIYWYNFPLRGKKPIKIGDYILYKKSK